MVTGASGGIGEAISRELARRGYGLVLVARSEDKLRSLAAELGGAEVVGADLGTEEGRATLFAALGERVPQVLVNNAGFSNYGEFGEIEWARQRDLMRLNMEGLTELCHWALPLMAGAGTGWVMNVASTAAFFPGPFMAVYYASKAYVLSLSEALDEEMRGTGVRVCALCPGPTASGFQERAQMEGSKLMQGGFMSSEAVARIGVAGMLAGKGVVIPGGMNQFLTFMSRFMPRGLRAPVIRRAQERMPGH